LREASPVTYVTPDDAPFLIIHGDQDTVVPVTQSQALSLTLTAAGVRNILVIVKNAQHGLEPVGAPIQPPLEEVQKVVADFLDAELRR
jgi:dipeptidyl aminopeptidase/acylaminoacyl peptidase